MDTKYAETSETTMSEHDVSGILILLFTPVLRATRDYVAKQHTLSNATVQSSLLSYGKPSAHIQYPTQAGATEDRLRMATVGLPKGSLNALDGERTGLSTFLVRGGVCPIPDGPQIQILGHQI